MLAFPMADINIDNGLFYGRRLGFIASSVSTVINFKTLSLRRRV